MIDNQLAQLRLTHDVPRVEARLHRRIERLLQEKTHHLGFTCESREQLLPLHLSAVIVEVAPRTMLWLECRTFGDNTRRIGVKQQRTGESPQ